MGLLYPHCKSFNSIFYLDDPLFVTPASVISKKNFSCGFFNNDWRNIRSDKSPDLLGIETGQFGFVLNVGDITHPRFCLLDDDSDFENRSDTVVGESKSEKAIVVDKAVPAEDNNVRKNQPHSKMSPSAI